MNGLGLGELDIHAIPPSHVGGLLEEIVTHPAGNGDDWGTLLNECLRPADLDEHGLHLIHDLIIAVLLVDANNELLDAQQVDEASVLAGLTLHLTQLVVTLLDGGHEVTISGHHEHTNIGLSRAGNHVLDEIAMTGGINDGVVVALSEELLGGTFDGHTTLTLILLGVHVEGESEGAFAKLFGLFLELLHLAFGDTSELEEQTTSGRRLARVDVAADNDRHV